MGKTTTAAAAEPKAKRVQLTPQERVAKIEADLAAAKAKLEAKANKEKTEAAEKRAKLRDKLVELNTKHNELTDIVGDGAVSNVTIAAANTDETLFGEDAAAVEDTAA